MTTEGMTEQLMQHLRSAYDRLDNSGDIEVSPAVVADEVRRVIDPESESPTLLCYAAVLELRQMARSLCRKRTCIDDDSAAEQQTLFDGQLQRRYPATRRGDEVYVLREYMTLDERIANISRLENEGRAKLRHADALRSETEALIARGILQQAA